MEQTRAELEQLRERMDQMAKRLATLSRQVGEPAPQVFAYRYLSDPDAGMLGLVLMPEDDTLKVAAVTPGSPAEEAGIGSGDRIIAVDGKAVASKDGAHADVLQHIKAGQKVKLRVQHDGKTRTVTATAERRSVPAWSALLDETRAWHDKDMPKIDIQRIVREANDGVRHAGIALRSFSPWWGLNLVSLNKDLGSYFGTDKGALLLSSDDDSLPGLKAGDVITRLGDTTVDRPEDAMRALREHAGNKVRASIVRHGKRMQVNVQLPEHKFALPPVPPKPPKPPKVPAAPKPPHMSPPVPPAPPAPPSKSAPAL